MNNLEISQTSEEANLRAARGVLLNRLGTRQAAQGWVNETALEYRRLRVLREHGGSEMPAEGSVLSDFLALAPSLPGVREKGLGVRYVDLFGHEPPYNWRISPQQLTHTGEGGGIPGAGATL
jgi:hypothetical protein